MRATKRGFFCLVPLAIWSYVADDRLTIACSMVAMFFLLPLWMVERELEDDD